MSLLIIGATHLLREALRPELHDVSQSGGRDADLPRRRWLDRPSRVIESGRRVPRGRWSGGGHRPDAGDAPAIGFGFLLGRDCGAVRRRASCGFIAIVWGGSLDGDAAPWIEASDVQRAASRQPAGTPARSRWRTDPRRLEVRPHAPGRRRSRLGPDRPCRVARSPIRRRCPDAQPGDPRGDVRLGSPVPERVQRARRGGPAAAGHRQLRVRQPERDAAARLRRGAPPAPRAAGPGLVRLQDVRADVAGRGRAVPDAPDGPRVGSGRRRDDQRRLRRDQRRAPGRRASRATR